MGSDFWRKQLIASLMAGAISRHSIAPVDTVKVLKRVDSTQTTQLGLYGAVRQIVAQGLLAPVRRRNGIRGLKTTPETDERVLKTRLALSRTSQYTGMFDCPKTSMRKERLNAFYRGYVPTHMGTTFYTKIVRNSQLPCLTSSSCGLLSGYPLAVTHQRMQEQASQNTPLSVSVMPMLETVIGNGVSGSIRFSLFSLLRTIPSIAISYLIYQQVKNTFGISK